MSETKLRVPSTKVRPLFDADDPHRGIDEMEGSVGKGPLVGKYGDALDMEFIAFRAKERRDQDTDKVSVRLPSYVLSDIAAMVQSNKLPFRDKSQFIRSAVFILANYYGRKFPAMVKKTKIQDGIDSCDFEDHMDRAYITYLKKLERISSQVLAKSDDKVNKFIEKQVKVIQGVDDQVAQCNLIEKFKKILTDHGINPIPYFGDGEEEE